MNAPSLKHTPFRPAFTAAQLRAAAETGYVTDTHRHARRSIITHPIDNVPPSVASDRDDGIFVEASAHNGGYRVHITIADVAAHIPPASPLARAGWERAFTVYRPTMTDPMFPKPLEDRLSLEHQQERLGLTISIDLDSHFNATHTEFTPTLTHGDNSDYAMASERMQSDPQFKLMATIADGVRQQLKSREMPDLFWRRHERSLNLTPTQLAATKLVETFMLLANEQTARFFSDSGLPFLFRNFDYNDVDQNGIARASYSTSPLGHQQLAASGWNGRYCHITSPIRRGPDFFNAHMIHYVIDTLAATEHALSEAYPHADAGALHTSCWKHAPQLFQQLTTPMHGGNILKQPLVTAWLAGRLEDAGCHMLAPATLQPITDALLASRPPLTRKQLDSHADEINVRNHGERLDELDIRRRQREEERHQTRLKTLGSITHGSLTHDRQAFSTLLRDAALSGYLPEPLLHEAERRIDAGDIEPSSDGLSVMVIARYPHDPAWITLKRAMARAIKHNPAAVNNILTMATDGGHLQGALHIAETSLPLNDAQVLPNIEKNVQGAIMVLQEHDNGTIAPPYYSIGHDGRSASSHAKYSFLEHYAFGQLRPLEQSAIPNLLYAELGDSTQSRRAIVQQMVQSLGAELAITHTEPAAGDTHYTATVNGGAIKAPIIATATRFEEHHTHDLETVALRRLLRHSAFMNATQFPATPELHNALHPREYLEKRSANAQGTLAITWDEKRLRGGRSSFTAHTTLTLPDSTPVHVSRSGPNKDRAIHDACTAMLTRLGWSPPLKPINARAWVTDGDEASIAAKTASPTAPAQL